MARKCLPSDFSLKPITPDQGLLMAAAGCTGSVNHLVAFYIDKYLEACSWGWDKVAVQFEHKIREKLVSNLPSRYRAA